MQEFRWGARYFCPAQSRRRWVQREQQLSTVRKDTFAQDTFQNTTARDPGARTGTDSAGKSLPSLSADELAYFNDGLARFNEVDSVGGS